MPTSSGLTLRITVAFRGAELGFTLEVVGSEDVHLSAAGSFIPQASRNLSTELQWYLEDFLDERDAAALARAKQVRETVKASGKELFRRFFESNAECRAIWRHVSTKLRQTRIEVFENGELSGIPWEILRDPTTNAPLCLSSATFVHSHGTPSVSVFTPLTRLRVLLVISRPDGRGDVELRTIASSIYGSLRESERFEVDVLRPPTYQALEHRLRQAAAQGMAYDLVHFDGHGTYYPPGVTDSGEQFGGGYLVFEDDGTEHGGHISGETFGLLAHECGVKAIVLNACRSAYRETTDSEATSSYRPVSSFAQAALAGGVPAILAMNFNVYVTSAKTYMEEFYRHLQQGKSLSVAASLARKHLSIDRARFQQDASDIDDWLVPTLFQNGADLSVEPSNEKLRQPQRRLPGTFPVAPDLGFVGSDDAILQIDRSFDFHNIVLLFGLAGGGKSATSVEFASWYQETASNVESLLFTSFETSPLLTEVLAGVEPELGVRVRGLNLLDEALQTSIIADLAARGALWVWDNVETVSGLPADDRRHFAEFLQRAEAGGLKILLTARDEQEDWLNDETYRIEMPALRPSEAVELVKRILASRRIKKFAPELWAPLIDFAAGNPLTLRVVISSYLSSTKKVAAQSVASYVDALRRGVAQLDDTYGSERSKSLTASLNYGFQSAFDAHSLKLLSLLSLFRTYANSFTIWLMCKPITDKRAAGLPDHEFDWTIPGLQDETRSSIEVVLDKAVELGLLRKSEDHNYWLHPAIHLHLQPFFEISYPTVEQRQVAGRAFAEAQGIFSIQFVRTLQIGTRARSIETLTKEADNLDQALFISHANSWKQAEVGVLHGLNALLTHQGRFEQWRVQFSSVWDDFRNLCTSSATLF